MTLNNTQMILHEVSNSTQNSEKAFLYPSNPKLALQHKIHPISYQNTLFRFFKTRSWKLRDVPTEHDVTSPYSLKVPSLPRSTAVLPTWKQPSSNNNKPWRSLPAANHTPSWGQSDSQPLHYTRASLRGARERPQNCSSIFLQGGRRGTQRPANLFSL